MFCSKVVKIGGRCGRMVLFIFRWLVMPLVLSSGRQYFPIIVYKVGQ